MTRRCSILVLNHNGRDLLVRFLPSVLEAAQHNGGSHRVWVVDNASTDGSVGFLQERFPQVHVRQVPENRLYFAYNEVVAECDDDYVLLLNNDVLVEKDFIGSLLDSFSDPQVFAVMPRIDSDRLEERHIYRCVGRFEKGFLGTGRDETIDGRGYTLYAHCAACYDREKFLRLGGFDPIYWPMYSEELDICYQAWMRGWKVLFEPESSVYHIGSATADREYPGEERGRLREKTTMIFVLKNISDVRMLASFAAWSLARLGKALITIDRYRLGIFWELFRLMPSILASRRRAQAGRRLPDKLILQRIRRGSSGDCAGGA